MAAKALIRVALLSLAALLAHGVDGAEEPSVENNAARIRGTVVDAEGKPIRGAAARLCRYVTPNRRWGRWAPLGESRRCDTRGRFELSAGSETYVLLAIEAEGYARGYCTRSLEPNETLEVKVILKRPLSPTIEIVDREGKPVPRARIREYGQRGVNGGLRMLQVGLRSLELKLPESDDQGRLTLPDFPEGDVLNLTIEHPQFAPLEINDVPVRAGTVARAVMKPGVVLTLSQIERPGSVRLPWAVIDLRHEPFSHPSTIVQYQIDFDNDGKARLAIEPGKYHFLRLQHDDFYMTPTYMREGARIEKLEIAAGKNDHLQFDVRRRTEARGRVIDVETGEPVKYASLLGEIAGFEGTAFTGHDKWTFTGWADTDANGHYVLPISAGKARVSFQGDRRIAESTYVEFEAAADGSTVLPEIRVRMIPKLVGTVVETGGKPVHGAVVRLRGRFIGGEPILTDDEGHFEIQPEWVPRDEETGTTDFTQYVVAFDPRRPLAAIADVWLDKPERLKLTLEPTAPGWPLTAIAEEVNDWHRGIVPPEVAAENTRITLKGKPAPELDGIGWINTESLKLADLRGKFVLLDFWFTGCGPCHYDFPSVKLVHELYKEHGVVVIGIHNNSKSLQAVREHVEKIGLPFPIMVDHPDGRTVAAYEQHGVPDGYPCYVLIDPHGNVLLDDRTIPWHSLRGSKLEIIRKFVLER